MRGIRGFIPFKLADAAGFGGGGGFRLGANGFSARRIYVAA